MEDKGPKRKLYILILILLFIYEGYKFITTDGSGHPLLGALFDMIIILAIIIFLCHKKEFIEDQKRFIGQTYIENFFKKKNKE